MSRIASQVLQVCQDGDCTDSLGNLFWCLTTLTVNSFFPCLCLHTLLVSGNLFRMAGLPVIFEHQDSSNVFFLPRSLCTSRLCPVTGILHIYRAEECYHELELIRTRFMDSSVRHSGTTSVSCTKRVRGKYYDELPWPAASPLSILLLPTKLLCHPESHSQTVSSCPLRQMLLSSSFLMQTTFLERPEFLHLLLGFRIFHFGFFFFPLMEFCPICR